MSYPILYSATETNFDHNGIGILSACVSCEVTEEANGIFELAMTYPMDGIHFEDIADRAIIKAKADQFREPQLFRVYAISKPMNGIVTVLAEHISYGLSGIPVKPFSADSVALALTGLKNNAVVDCPFEFWTDKATSGKFSVPTPASIRSRLGGVSGSILDVYGGEYEFDNFTVKLHNNRGMSRGVSIRYGKNLTDIKQEQNCASVATGVYPYWAGNVDGNTVLVELPEKIINAPGTYNFVKIRTLDLSSEFETQPTVERLRSKTESYIKNNNIGVPSVSLTVSFAQLEQSEEYKHLKLLERVSLFDTVNVEFPALGVSATAKAVKMVYDVIADRVKSVTLGSVRANIADTIATQQTEIDKSKDKPTLSMVQKISSALSKAIMGANGGAVRLIDTNEDGEPDELYIADNPNPTQAVKVWRFNYNGWAASKNGYGGPFEFGATLEDGLLANFVTAAHLVAGTIESQDDGKTFFLDLDNGILRGQFSELSVSGKTVEDIAGEKAQDAENNAKEYMDGTLEDYSALVTKDIESLQSQIDGNITTWFGSAVPTTRNEPASEWTTTELKNQHLGDLYYIVDNEEQGGLVYRWTVTNNQYKWLLVEDVEVAKALQTASEAKDTADGKRRVFVSQPTPPYDVGDLWTDAADLRVCRTSRTAGGYSARDWKLATDYIDSATASNLAQQKVDAQTQEFIFNKLTNGGADQGLYIENGKVYLNGTYIKSGTVLADLIKAGVLQSKDGKSFVLDLDNNTLKANFSELTIAGTTVDTIAQNKANTAQANAISEAASDATAKANAAQSNAISTAATDATNKANAALESAKAYADSASNNAVDAQTQTDIFNKLTNNGTIQGLYMKNGQMYINASYLASGVIASADGSVLIDLMNNCVEVLTTNSAGNPGKIQLSSNGIKGFGWNTSAKTYVETMLLVPGDNGSAATATSLTSGSADGGLSLAPGKSGAPAFFGTPQSTTKIRGATTAISAANELSLSSTNGPVSIQPGKLLLWSGTCAIGSSITVPHTAKYDLFAIKLGDDSEIYNTTVLGYKSGNVVHGVGGFATDVEYYKRLFYVTVNLSGNTWTVTGACRHSIEENGTVNSEVSLSIKEIRGVI